MMSMRKKAVINWIISEIISRKRLYQKEIINYCKKHDLGTKPTILNILSEMEKKQIIVSGTKRREKDSSGGRPEKFYEYQLFSSEDGCDDCKLKYKLKEGERVEIALHICEDCRKEFCSGHIIETRRGYLCFLCANKHCRCPFCGEILFPDKNNQYICYDSDCRYYGISRDEFTIHRQFEALTNPNAYLSPKIDFTVKMLLPYQQITRLTICPICKEIMDMKKLKRHFINNHELNFLKEIDIYNLSSNIIEIHLNFEFYDIKEQDRIQEMLSDYVESLATDN